MKIFVNYIFLAVACSFFHQMYFGKRQNKRNGFFKISSLYLNICENKYSEDWQMQWQVISAKAVWKREQYKGIWQICSSVILVEVHLESVD